MKKVVVLAYHLTMRLGRSSIQKRKKISNYDKKLFMKLLFEYIGFHNFYVISNICVTCENYKTLIFLMGSVSKAFCRKLNFRKQVPKLKISKWYLRFPSSLDHRPYDYMTAKQQVSDIGTCCTLL